MLRTFKKAVSIVLVLSLFLSVFPKFTFADDKSSFKEFVYFSVEGSDPGFIDNVNHTINVVVPFRSAVNNMLETFTVSEGASVLDHTSGHKRTDYTRPVILTVVAEDGSMQDYTVTVTIGPSSLKSILTFSLSNPAVTGLIDDEAFAIFLTVPQGTSVTALKPIFTTDESAAKVKVNGVVQISGVSTQDFTVAQPLIYTVEALDGSTRNYPVTIFQKEPSTSKEITYFGLASLSSVGLIDETNHKIDLMVPFGTNLQSLAPAFTSTGTGVYVNGVQQISGEGVLDFSSPVFYVVYDEAGGSQTYTVTVQAATAGASTTKDMLTFAVADVEGTVNEAEHTISIILPNGGLGLNQIATFTTNGQTVKIGNVVQYSGMTVNDFTSPLTYTVIAENGLTQNYVVTVVLVNPSAKVASVIVPANGNYASGSHLYFTVAFDQAVIVDTTNGTPYLPLTIGSKSVIAAYASGSESNTLTFSYTVQEGDSDLDGIAVGSSLSLNGGTIKNSDRIDATLRLNNVGSTAAVLISTTATVSTTAVTNVTSTSASAGGDVTSEGSAAVTERGIVYSKSSNPTILDMQIVVAGTTGNFSSNLTGLTAGTTYYVRAFATNSVGTRYGNEVIFTTTLPNSVATVSTDPVTSITSISADVGGNVTIEGGAAVTVRGIVYSKSSNPTIPEDKQIIVAGTTGGYTSNLTGLEAGTIYHVRAFATNSVGTSYGDDVIFTTLPTTPPITTVIAMSLNKHTGTMQVGDTFTVVATATMSDTTTQDVTSLITWTADDPSKVSINNGVITALQSGSVTVQAMFSGTSVIVDHINLSITNPSIPETHGTQGTQGTQINGTNVITVEEPPVSTSPIFSTVVNIAKVISEITKKLEDSKGVSVNFNDTASHWADKTVKLFTKLGVLKGYVDGSFRPNDSITRGEFATIIFRVFGLTSSTSTTLSDVKDHWAEDAIMALSFNGIIAGYEDGTFKPDRQITRAEIISIISKLVVLKTTSSQGTFKDIDGVWNKDQIQAAASMGLVNGQSTDHFAPQSNATRAEVLTIILHVLELDSSLRSLFEK
ncbi:hypothetical protein J2T13_002482 [Paenibacillus sp. DS2015]|uniref:S-layer homology domain-containing protein n=1 Tax=Paenibacillus sp. DS2015 TaxID=3373917 RepID=UPI003D1CFBA4